MSASEVVFKQMTKATEIVAWTKLRNMDGLLGIVKFDWLKAHSVLVNRVPWLDCPSAGTNIQSVEGQEKQEKGTQPIAFGTGFASRKLFRHWPG